MAQNVTIAGASYTDVPAINVPKTGGGTATFLDITEQVITVNIASFNSLPQTVSDAAITADHVAVTCEPGTPTAQIGDWTVTTAAGSVTVSGTISGSTTLKLVLVRNGTTI